MMRPGDVLQRAGHRALLPVSLVAAPGPAINMDYSKSIVVVVLDILIQKNASYEH